MAAKNEVLNTLLNYHDLKIIQRKDMFNFSLDTVLLANFCTITKSTRKIIDFGTNNAAIPLILSTRTDKPIVGVEIQAQAVDLARRNVEMNNLTKQIEIRHQDINEYHLSNESYQLVVCNPPFFKVGEQSNLNEGRFLQIARHELKIDLEGIIKAAGRILDNGGKFAMVHRPERLLEILDLYRRYDIEPKRLRFIYPKVGKEANTILIEGTYKGKKGLKVLPPLYAHNDDGSYSDEVMTMFGGK